MQERPQRKLRPTGNAGQLEHEALYGHAEYGANAADHNGPNSQFLADRQVSFRTPFIGADEADNSPCEAYLPDHEEGVHDEGNKGNNEASCGGRFLLGCEIPAGRNGYVAGPASPSLSL